MHGNPTGIEVNLQLDYSPRYQGPTQPKIAARTDVSLSMADDLVL